MAAVSGGAIVGSAIVRLCEKYGSEAAGPIGEYVRSMKAGCAAKRLKAVTECHRPTLRQLSINRQFSIAGQDLTFQVVNSMIFKQASKCETPGCTGSSS